MSNYFNHLMRDLRLTILRVLAEAPRYTANDSVLVQAAESYGLPVTRDHVRGQLSWLEAQALVKLDRPTATLTIATATQGGLDIAADRAHHPEITRPSPGA